MDSISFIITITLGALFALQIGLLASNPDSPIIAGCAVFSGVVFLVNLVTSVRR